MIDEQKRLPRLDEQAVIVVDGRTWKQIMRLLENPPKATPGLIAALKRKR